eukprot:Trichotokara_eunicae@DN6314_c1_g1_i1.p1
MYFEIPLPPKILGGVLSPPTYITNINGVRNQAFLELFAVGFDWVLPLDGNVFLTDQAVNRLRRFVSRQLSAASYQMLQIRYYRGRKALILKKSLSNFRVGNFPSQKRIVQGEPQIGFSRMTPLLFSENLNYGQADKVSLIKRFKTAILRGRVGCTKPGRGGRKACPYCIRLPYHSHSFRDNFNTHGKDRHKKRLASVETSNDMLWDVITAYNSSYQTFENFKPIN